MQSNVFRTLLVQQTESGWILFEPIPNHPTHITFNAVIFQQNDPRQVAHIIVGSGGSSEKTFTLNFRYIV